MPNYYGATNDVITTCDEQNINNKFQILQTPIGTITQLPCLCQSYPLLALLEDYGSEHDRQCGYYAVHNAEVFAHNADKNTAQLIALLNDRQDFQTATLTDCKSRIQKKRGPAKGTKDLFGSEIEELLPEDIREKVIIIGAAKQTGNKAADDEEDVVSKEINDAKILGFKTGILDSLIWIIPANHNDHWITVLAHKDKQGNVEIFVADSLGQDRSVDPEVRRELENILQTLSAQPEMEVEQPQEPAQQPAQQEAMLQQEEQPAKKSGKRTRKEGGPHVQTRSQTRAAAQGQATADKHPTKKARLQRTKK